MIADADAEMKKRHNDPNGAVDGIYYPMPELNEDPDHPADPDDPFTATLQVEAEQISLAFGIMGDSHTLPRSLVEVMLAEQVQRQASGQES